MYAGIPQERFLIHNWRNDVVKIGTVPASFICEISEKIVNTPIDVEVNRLLISGNYDLILSIGQVVPHEVAGMANRNKNIFVGAVEAPCQRNPHAWRVLRSGTHYGA